MTTTTKIFAAFSSKRPLLMILAVLLLLMCMRITTASAELVEDTGSNVLRGSSTSTRFTGNDKVTQEDDYNDLNSERQDEHEFDQEWQDNNKPSIIEDTDSETTIVEQPDSGDYNGSVEVVTDAVDDAALQRCLQRRDLEEVFGLNQGVICTCIGMAPIDFSGGNERDGDNNTTTTESSVQVSIVVQLTCTDSQSRFNTEAGQLQYCIPKDDYCNVDSANFCCGNRYCDLQRQQCVAPATSTSTRNGVTNLKIGSINQHRDDPDREKPVSSSSFVRGRSSGP